MELTCGEKTELNNHVLMKKSIYVFNYIHMYIYIDMHTIYVDDIGSNMMQWV